MSNIIKNMKTLSLLLVGLVAFNLTSCGCDKDDKGANKIKQGEKKTFKFEFNNDAPKEAIFDAPEFEQDGKTLEVLNIGEIKKGSKDIEIQAKEKAAKGEKTVKIVSADKKTTYADIKVTIEEK